MFEARSCTNENQFTQIDSHIKQKRMNRANFYEERLERMKVFFRCHDFTFVPYILVKKKNIFHSYTFNIDREKIYLNDCEMLIEDSRKYRIDKNICSKFPPNMRNFISIGSKINFICT